MRSACSVSACARPTVTMPIGASLRAEDAAVEPVGACPGKGRRDTLLHHAALQFGAVGGEAQMRIVVQPVRRQREVGRDEVPVGRDDQRAGLFGGLGGGLQRDPRPQKRDSAMPARPRSTMSATEAGFSTGINTPSKTCSV